MPSIQGRCLVCRWKAAFPQSKHTYKKADYTALHFFPKSTPDASPSKTVKAPPTRCRLPVTKTCRSSLPSRWAAASSMDGATTTSVSGSRARQVSARELWRVSFETIEGSTFVFTSSMLVRTVDCAEGGLVLLGLEGEGRGEEREGWG